MLVGTCPVHSAVKLLGLSEQSERSWQNKSGVSSVNSAHSRDLHHKTELPVSMIQEKFKISIFVLLLLRTLRTALSVYDLNAEVPSSFSTSVNGKRQKYSQLQVHLEAAPELSPLITCSSSADEAGTGGRICTRRSVATWGDARFKQAREDTGCSVRVEDWVHQCC